MTKYGGYMGKVLDIDLSSQTYSLYPWSAEEQRLYLGGKIMAARIIADNVAPTVGAFDDANILVVSTGPLNGCNTPTSARFNVSTISPLTGLLTSSNCGGNFGIYLKKAGYDALILRNKATAQVWLEISEDQVLFHDATRLWGKTTSETQELLPGSDGYLVIGPAGEHRVKFANLTSGERVAGRGGTGAVLGDKNVKAIVARGSRKPDIVSSEKTKQLTKKWVTALRRHPFTGGRLPKYGTAGLVRSMQKGHTLATRNFACGQYDDYEAISGETLSAKYLIKNKGCMTCPIQCGRQVERNGQAIKGPELETIGLWGPNLLNSDLQAIIEWNYQMDELGMDTISAAGCVAFAMELNEKGLWNSGLEFGVTDQIPRVLHDIAYRRGIGDELAEGTRYLSEKYGGSEFAMQVKGMELSAYEPRGAVGQGLGYAVSNRGGDHLNAGYTMIYEGLALNVPQRKIQAKAELTVLNQNLMEAASAAGSCLFTLYAFVPGFLMRKPGSLISRAVNAMMASSLVAATLRLVMKANDKVLPIHMPGLPHSQLLSAVTGMHVKFMTLCQIGERGYNLERMYNIQRGLTAKDDQLPGRLVNELEDPMLPDSKVPLAILKKKYYKVRGWDQAGVPLAKTLERLRLRGLIGSGA